MKFLGVLLILEWWELRLWGHVCTINRNPQNQWIVISQTWDLYEFWTMFVFITGLACLLSPAKSSALPLLYPHLPLQDFQPLQLPTLNKLLLRSPGACYTCSLVNGQFSGSICAALSSFLPLPLGFWGPVPLGTKATALCPLIPGESKAFLLLYSQETASSPLPVFSQGF